jgi:hypothetical protein
MNRNLPSRAQSFLCRQTRIVQPALIEKLCRAVWTSGPCERRNGVDYKANVLALVFASLVFDVVQGVNVWLVVETDEGRERIDDLPKFGFGCPNVLGSPAECFRGY